MITVVLQRPFKNLKWGLKEWDPSSSEIQFEVELKEMWRLAAHQKTLRLTCRSTRKDAEMPGDSISPKTLQLTCWTTIEKMQKCLVTLITLDCRRSSKPVIAPKITHYSTLRILQGWGELIWLHGESESQIKEHLHPADTDILIIHPAGLNNWMSVIYLGESSDSDQNPPWRHCSIVQSDVSFCLTGFSSWPHETNTSTTLGQLSPCGKWKANHVHILWKLPAIESNLQLQCCTEGFAFSK